MRCQRLSTPLRRKLYRFVGASECIGGSPCGKVSIRVEYKQQWQKDGRKFQSAIDVQTLFRERNSFLWQAHLHHCRAAYALTDRAPNLKFVLFSDVKDCQRLLTSNIRIAEPELQQRMIEHRIAHGVRMLQTARNFHA